MDIEKIRVEMLSLLDACYASDEPVSVLNAELNRLQQTGEWSHLELAQLQTMTLERVKSIGK